MIEVKRKDRETSESLIRRFGRRVQQSGVLMQARKSRFRADEKSKREKREGAMYKIKVKKVVDKLKKMGKFDEEEFRNVKKKLVKKEN
jgi:ribosomal protein S21